MELPARLRAAVDALLDGAPVARLREASARLTARYRAETRDGRLHLDGETAALAYLAARLPATYAAVRSAMAMTAEMLPDLAPASLLDVGAGPGTALWAAQDCWPGLERATMLEASPHILPVGQHLSASLDIVGEWVGGDAARDLGRQPGADLVTLCYVLDELTPVQVTPLVEQLWRLAGQSLLIVEPGTPAGWRRVLQARDLLIGLGAHIAAPCVHQRPCPIAAPDWCHFARRVARSRIHRLVKDGDAPWEDEKFIFVAASRAAPEQRPSRILAPPAAPKGRIELKLCTPQGEVSLATISKRDGDAYRAARRADWGDTIRR